MIEDRPDDLKTRAYVLRRTNYREADRILNLITPVGKVSVMAKGVRKAKSKLAGAVEIFTLSEVNLHFGKSEFATLTGAKMIRFYSAILKEYERMEKATDFLRKISRAAETVDNSEHFMILDKCLLALNDGANIEMVDAWFMLRLARSMGEQINLLTDVDGNTLEAEKRYDWDARDLAFFETENGIYSADEIKVLRLMWAMDLDAVMRVKDINNYATKVLKIAQAVQKV